MFQLFAVLCRPTFDMHHFWTNSYMLYMPSMTHSDGSITSMSVISPCLLIGHIRSYTPPNSVVILVASRWFIPLVVSTLRKKCSFGLILLDGWNIMNFIIFFSPPSNTSKMTIIRRFHSWLVVYLPLWKMMEFVSWDDYIFPTEWKIIKAMFQTTNQILYMAIQKVDLPN